MDSSIPVGSTGLSLQTFENDVGGSFVHSEAVTPTDPTGVPFSEANPQHVSLVGSAIVSTNPALRTLDSRDVLGDTLFGINGVGANGWGESGANAAGFGGDYEPPLSDSVGYAGPTFERIQDPALYGGRPFTRVSATGGDSGGWLSIATKIGVNVNTLYEVGIVVRSDVTTFMTLAVFDGAPSILSVQNDAGRLLQAQRYSGRHRTPASTAKKHAITPYVLVYVGAGVESVAILDILEFGVRAVDSDGTQDLTSLAAATVTDDGTIPLIAGGDGSTREVTISVPATADVGIHVNFDADATTANFFIEKGTRSPPFRTQQEIRAIRGGASNVTAYLIVGTP